jgi:hypothetical protein
LVSNFVGALNGDAFGGMPHRFMVAPMGGMYLALRRPRIDLIMATKE